MPGSSVAWVGATANAAITFATAVASVWQSASFTKSWSSAGVAPAMNRVPRSAPPEPPALTP